MQRLRYDEVALVKQGPDRSGSARIDAANQTACTKAGARKAHRRTAWRWVSAMFGVLACLIAMESFASAEQRTEYEVKAAFIYNFARFVEWPATAFERPDAPIVICVLGEDPFGHILDDTVRGKMVGQRPLSIRRIDVAAKAQGCHIVFISRSEHDRLAHVLAAFRDKPVMTIADIEGATQRGAVLNFILENGHVRFAINANSARRAGLNLSSQLVKLATAVNYDSPAP